MKYTKYKEYTNVGDWYREEGRRARFPIQAAHAIQTLQQTHDLSFHEAFETLLKEEAIVFFGNLPAFDLAKMPPVPRARSATRTGRRKVDRRRK